MPYSSKPGPGQGWWGEDGSSRTSTPEQHHVISKGPGHRWGSFQEEAPLPRLGHVTMGPGLSPWEALALVMAVNFGTR